MKKRIIIFAVLVLIAQSLCSQVSYPRTYINSATGDTITEFTSDQVYALTDTITKLVDKTTELTLANKYMDSLYTVATTFINRQEQTIRAYNELKPVYEALVIKNREVEDSYNREIKLKDERLALEKKKNVSRIFTFIGIALGLAGGAFLIGYFVAK